MKKAITLIVAGLLLTLAPSKPPYALTAGAMRQETLIVVNQQSAVSRRIGEYYRSARGIPRANVCTISVAPQESVNPATYLQQIETPVESFLQTNNLSDQIKFIVTTKGVPLKVLDGERCSSVDSCLTLMFNNSAYGRIAVGRNGVIPYIGAAPNPFYASTDTFSNFRADPKRNSVSDAFPQIRDIALLPSGDVVAVGNKGVIIRKDSSGWAVVPDDHKSFVISNLTSVFFASSSTGWATSDDGRIIATSDGGLNWTRVRGGSSPAERLNDVSFASTSEGWAVGQNANKAPVILHLQSTWQPEASGLTTGALYSVSAPDSAHVWACGSKGVILRRTGGVWSQQTGVPNTTYRSIAMLNVGGAYHGWAVGDSAGGNVIILHTTNGGDTWTQQTSGLNGVTGKLSQVFALDQNRAWVTTSWDDTRVLRTTNAGSHWDGLVGDYSTKISLTFSDANNGYAVGTDADSGHFAAMTSTDAGAHWSSQFAGIDSIWKLRYLVCRLDGYSEDKDKDGLPDDVKAIIDRAMSPQPAGGFVLDVAPGQDTSSAKLGNDQIRDARTSLNTAGAPNVLDESLGVAAQFLTGAWLQSHFGNSYSVGGYCSWGTNDYYHYYSTQWARPLFDWKPGGIAMTYVSSDGRTFNEPDFMYASSNKLKSTVAWSNINVLHVGGLGLTWRASLHDNSNGMTYTATASNAFADIAFSGSVTNGYLEVNVPDPNSPGNYIPLPGATLTASTSAPIVSGWTYSLSYPQSLIGDLIHEGCSGAVANVSEPYLDACGCPDQAFPRYASGYTWAESAYSGLRYLSWMEVVIGDPLMAPYAPLVKITSPAKGSAVSGTITVTATATDPKGVNRAELFLDGVSQGIDTSAPYQWTVNTTQGGITDGRHEIEVAAYRDTSGVTYRGYDYAEIVVSNTKAIVTPYNALGLPENTSVTVAGAIANCDSDAMGGWFYAESPLKFSAIRITPPSGQTIFEGCEITAQGTINTVDGERRLLATQLAVGSWPGTPSSMGFAGIRLGGRHTASVVPAIPGTAGLYNVGLLATILGTVQSPGADYFYLDDGSGLIDASGNHGIRVQCGALTKPTGFAAVTGVSGAATISGAFARVLRVRKQDDIQLQ